MRTNLHFGDSRDLQHFGQSGQLTWDRWDQILDQARYVLPAKKKLGINVSMPNVSTVEKHEKGTSNIQSSLSVNVNLKRNVVKIDSFDPGFGGIVPNIR